jgi:hypothetical protein
VKPDLPPLFPFHFFPGTVEEAGVKLMVTLSTHQGNRAYVPNNSQGPLPPPTPKKGAPPEPPKEPSVELVPFTRLHFSEALRVRSLLF